MSLNINKLYGWKPEIPDKRDLLFKITKPAPVPTSIDLRPLMPPVYDQLQIGSCVSNAVAAAFEYERKKQKLSDWVPSRLFIYYNGRVIENTVNYDDGLYVRDGIKSVVKTGTCSESSWPYDPNKVTIQPIKSCYDTAKLNEVTSYYRLNNSSISDLKQCLIAGYPFVMGFTVYSSFESDIVARTGIVPMPNFKTESVLGGHSILCCGYNTSKNAFLMRNSWGTSWGINGYFWMPYQYVIDPNLCDDFWTIRMVSGK